MTPNWFTSLLDRSITVPEGAATGDAEIIIKNGDKTVASGKLKIVDTKPALFTTGSDKRNLAVGMTSTDGVVRRSEHRELQRQPAHDQFRRAWAEYADFARNRTALRLGCAGSNRRPGSRSGVRQPVGHSWSRSGHPEGSDNLARRMNTISLVATSPSSATTQSGATTLAAGEAQSSPRLSRATRFKRR